MDGFGSPDSLKSADGNTGSAASCGNPTAGIRPTVGHTELLAATVIWLGCLVLAHATDAPPFDPSLPVTSRCVVAIDSLRPTQFAIGYREVEERAQNIAGKSPKKLAKYMEEHLPLIVIGPGGMPYLVDGHHLALALLKHGLGDHIEARIEANWQSRAGRVLEEHAAAWLGLPL